MVKNPPCSAGNSSLIPGLGTGGFTGVAVEKNLPASVGDVRDSGSIPGLGRSPEEGNGYPLQYSSPENPNGQRSLEGYRPWGCKEPDMT